MKSLMLGIGLSTLALPNAGAVAGYYPTRTLDDWRTSQANLSTPVVQVKRQYVSVMPYNSASKSPISHYKLLPPHTPVVAASSQNRIPTILPHEPVHEPVAEPDTAPAAKGWQRSSKIAPHGLRRPTKRPIIKRMYAFAGSPPDLKTGQQLHQIVGNAQADCTLTVG